MSKEQKNNSNSYAEIKQGKRPKFKRGNPGRPKGAKDKITIGTKENIEKVVQELGGWQGILKWAKKNSRNQGLLYSWYFKMLPTNVSVEGDMSLTYQISDKFMPKTGDEKK